MNAKTCLECTNGLGVKYKIFGQCTAPIYDLLAITHTAWRSIVKEDTQENSEQAKVVDRSCAGVRMDMLGMMPLSVFRAHTVVTQCNDYHISFVKSNTSTRAVEHPNLLFNFFYF